jgi:predicted MFS family arabinose efflux permease
MSQAPRPRLVGLIAETTAIQAVGTMAVLVVPAIAPKIAQTIGVPAGRVGFQISLLYLAAMFGSLAAGTLVARLGPCRSGQIAMLLTAAGSILAAIGNLVTLLLGSLVIGAAYGIINPASSDLLIRNVPPARRNLFFSIKQTGVPLGGMIIGLLAPWTALRVSWSAPLWIVAASAVALAAASQPHRAGWDAHRDASVKLSGLSVGGFRSLAQSPALVRLACASFCFAAIQLCLLAFLVVLLVEELGFDLISAGAILAAVQVVGALGRILWGIVADRLRNGLAVLLGLALLMALSSAAVVGLSPAGPKFLIIAVFQVLGISAVGWNGVFLSEIARLSPPRAIGLTTGAAMFVTFMGVVAGPPVFSALQSLLRSYAWSYALLVVLALIAAVLIRAAQKAARGSRRAPSS